MSGQASGYWEYAEFSTLRSLSDDEYSVNEESAKASTEAADVDVILVAGLGGHFRKTWQAKDGTVWPRDLLSKSFEKNGVKHKLRIRSFDYTMTLRGTTSKVGLREHAKDLIDRLSNEREDDRAAAERPLVFVGHSLGGMIIKQALKLAAGNIMDIKRVSGYEDTVNHRFRSIWRACRGVMFFSTPHLGMEERAWPLFARHVLQLDAPAKRACPTKAMLKELRLNSEGLYRLTEDFAHLRDQLAFVTFIESKPMRGLKRTLVNEINGKMHGCTERHQMVDGDHVGLCKFNKTDEDEFDPVWQKIKFLIGSKTRKIDFLGSRKQVEQARRAISSLCPDDFHYYSLDKHPTEGTCGWIAERPEFKGWRDKEPGMERLWISGPPACGKSFLARHIITDLIPRDEEPIHCFLSDSSPARGTLEALLSATLHQVLGLESNAAAKRMVKPTDSSGKATGEPAKPVKFIRSFVRLIRDFVLPTFEKAEESAPHNRVIWPLETLKSLWPDVMAAVTEHRPLTVVIDGFDEIAEKCRSGFLDCLEQFEKKSRTPQNLRLIILSRDTVEDGELEAAIQASKFRKHPVTAGDTRGNIRTTVEERLKRTWGSNENRNGAEREGITNAIVEGAAGNYLWATMAADELSRSPTLDEKQAAALPPTLDDLYERNIQRILTQTKDTAFLRQVLLWVIFQQGTLKETEFNTAQAVGLAMEKNAGEAISEQDITQFLAGNIAAKVEYNCGQLVRVRDGRLELVHKSLQPHVAKLWEKLRPSDHLPSGHEASEEERAHGDVASICITYLSMPHFQDPGDTKRGEGWRDRWESKIRSRISANGFLRYAARYWHKHHKAAGTSWANQHPAVEDRRKQLADKTEPSAKSWTEVWWFLTRWPAKEYPQVCPADEVIHAEPPAEPKRTLSTPPPRVTTKISDSPSSRGNLPPSRGVKPEISGPASIPHHISGPTLMSSHLAYEPGDPSPSAKDGLTPSIPGQVLNPPKMPTPEDRGATESRQVLLEKQPYAPASNTPPQSLFYTPLGATSPAADQISTEESTAEDDSEDESWAIDFGDENPTGEDQARGEPRQVETSGGNMTGDTGGVPPRVRDEFLDWERDQEWDEESRILEGMVGVEPTKAEERWEDIEHYEKDLATESEDDEEVMEGKTPAESPNKALAGESKKITTPLKGSHLLLEKSEDEDNDNNDDDDDKDEGEGGGEEEEDDKGEKERDTAGSQHQGLAIERDDTKEVAHLTSGRQTTDIENEDKGEGTGNNEEEVRGHDEGPHDAQATDQNPQGAKMLQESFSTAPAEKRRYSRWELVKLRAYELGRAIVDPIPEV